MKLIQYWEEKLGDLPEEADQETVEVLETWPMDSVCGKICIDIMDRTRDLLAICDPHPSVTTPIKAGAMAAIQVVCFG